MADRNRRNDPEPGWGEIFAGVATAAAAVGGIAYMFSQMSTDDSTNKNDMPRNTRTLSFESKQQFKAEKEMIIAVDATPRKGGGVLHLPDHKTVYFYSVDWTSHFNFSEVSEEQQSDKFEMINALLALEAFEPLLRTYFRKYDKLIFKTDNTFFKRTTKKYQDPNDQNLFDNIIERIERFQGKWQNAYQHDDCDMFNANQLSRNNKTFRPTNYNQHYDVIDENQKAGGALGKIKSIVPTKYHRNIISGDY